VPPPNPVEPAPAEPPPAAPVGATALPPPEPTPSPAEDAAVPPTAGVHNGIFFIRDLDDDYRLYFQGRAMIDVYSFFGAGVEHVPSLTPSIFLRKVRMEFTGELQKTWQWFFGGDFGNNSTALGANQAPVVRAAPADVFINYKAAPIFQIEVGQFDMPFTAETRTGDKFLTFVERSIPVRVLGKGNIKESGVMVWGHLDKRQVLYSAALVQGDGMNRPNVDRRFDLAARVFVRPLALGSSPLNNLQFGASGRYGSRQTRFVSYDYPSMTTLGGFAFWRPVYGAPISAMNPNGATRVIPSGDQVLLAAEIRIPTASFDVSAEGIYAKENTREAQDVDLSRSLRFGAIESFGYYVQLGYWPTGDAYLNGIPGDQSPTSIDFSKPDKSPAGALQLLVKWEQLRSEYLSNERSGATPGGIDGKIKVNALSLGANYWIAKAIRLTANYVFNSFPGSKPSTPTPGRARSEAWSSDQRAQAPGNQLRAGVDDGARDGAHDLHELLFRAQVAF
jgi:phosphate-selective porin